MRSALAFILVGLALLLTISSCATTSAEREPLGPGEIRLIGANFPEFGGIKKNVKYPVDIKFEADGRPEVTRVCVNWNVYNAGCGPLLDINYGTGVLRADVPTPMDGLYMFRAYVYYTRHEISVRSNAVEIPVTIVP